MSLLSGRMLKSIASGALKASKALSVPVANAGLRLTTQRGLQGFRTFARGLWYMRCSDTPTQLPSVVKPQAVAGWTRSCGCCGVHTEGDTEMAEFLSEEIKMEKEADKSPGKLPKIKGFEVEADGTEIVLTKTQADEIVKVRFNVNNTVDEESGSGLEESTQNPEPQAPQMLSKPPFLVEIKKEGPLTLAIQCTFPYQGDLGPQESGQQDQYEDVIEIEEVTLHNGEWDEKVYAVNASIMDGNLYDLLLNLLEERGIDADFVDNLVDFSTAFEHKKYIKFLEELKGFVSAGH